MMQSHMMERMILVAPNRRPWTRRMTPPARYGVAPISARKKSAVPKLYRRSTICLHGSHGPKHQPCLLVKPLRRDYFIPPSRFDAEQKAIHMAHQRLGVRGVYQVIKSFEPSVFEPYVSGLDMRLRCKIFFEQGH